MTASPPPDFWATLYQKHRHAMYRVAARMLRSAGRLSEADDVVMMAMESLMKSPLENVQSWEAVMIRATQLRALDLLKSAAVRHNSGKELEDMRDAMAGFDDDVAEAIDRNRAAAVAAEKLTVLSERHRFVAWEYLAKARPRGEVAAELGISPGRISQLAGEAIKQLKDAMEREGVGP